MMGLDRGQPGKRYLERKGAGRERRHPGAGGKKGLLASAEGREAASFYLQSGVQISKGVLLIRLDKIYKASGHI